MMLTEFFTATTTIFSDNIFHCPKHATYFGIFKSHPVAQVYKYKRQRTLCKTLLIKKVTDLILTDIREGGF